MTQAHIRRSPRRRAGSGIFVPLLALAALAGCRGERTLSLTSTPLGAEVRLDDQRIGVTPVKVAIDHYGTRRLTMYRAGSRLYSEPLELKAPWWSYFPIDVFTEVLNPVQLHDRQTFHVDLQPATGVEADPVTASFIEEAIRVRSEGRVRAAAAAAAAAAEEEAGTASTTAPATSTNAGPDQPRP